MLLGVLEINLALLTQAWARCSFVGSWLCVRWACWNFVQSCAKKKFSFILLWMFFAVLYIFFSCFFIWTIWKYTWRCVFFLFLFLSICLLCENKEEIVIWCHLLALKLNEGFDIGACHFQLFLFQCCYGWVTAWFVFWEGFVKRILFHFLLLWYSIPYTPYFLWFVFREGPRRALWWRQVIALLLWRVQWPRPAVCTVTTPVSLTPCYTKDFGERYNTQPVFWTAQSQQLTMFDGVLCSGRWMYPLTTWKSTVSDQNGVSLQWYIVEIHHSGWKPSK